MPWQRDVVCPSQPPGLADGCRAFPRKSKERPEEGWRGTSHPGTGDGQQAPGWAVVPGRTCRGASQLCLVAEFSCWALLAPEMTRTLERGIGKKVVFFPHLQQLGQAWCIAAGNVLN